MPTDPAGVPPRETLDIVDRLEFVLKVGAGHLTNLITSAIVEIRQQRAALSALPAGREADEEREHVTLEMWRIAALLKDRTRRAIRERARAGENHMELADDFGVPLAVVSHLAQTQLFEDDPALPAGPATNLRDLLNDG